jgi:hypothetical protein
VYLSLFFIAQKNRRVVQERETRIEQFVEDDPELIDSGHAVIEQVVVAVRKIHCVLVLEIIEEVFWVCRMPEAMVAHKDNDGRVIGVLLDRADQLFCLVIGIGKVIQVILVKFFVVPFIDGLDIFFMQVLIIEKRRMGHVEMSVHKAGFV